MTLMSFIQPVLEHFWCDLKYDFLPVVRLYYNFSFNQMKKTNGLKKNALNKPKVLEKTIIFHGLLNNTLKDIVFYIIIFICLNQITFKKLKVKQSLKKIN